MQTKNNLRSYQKNQTSKDQEKFQEQLEMCFTLQGYLPELVKIIKTLIYICQYDFLGDKVEKNLILKDIEDENYAFKYLSKSILENRQQSESSQELEQIILKLSKDFYLKFFDKYKQDITFKNPFDKEFKMCIVKFENSCIIYTQYFSITKEIYFNVYQFIDPDEFFETLQVQKKAEQSKIIHSIFCNCIQFDQKRKIIIEQSFDLSFRQLEQINSKLKINFRFQDSSLLLLQLIQIAIVLDSYGLYYNQYDKDHVGIIFQNGKSIVKLRKIFTLKQNIEKYQLKNQLKIRYIEFNKKTIFFLEIYSIFTLFEEFDNSNAQQTEQFQMIKKSICENKDFLNNGIDQKQLLEILEKHFTEETLNHEPMLNMYYLQKIIDSNIFVLKQKIKEKNEQFVERDMYIECYEDIKYNKEFRNLCYANQFIIWLNNLEYNKIENIKELLFNKYENDLNDNDLIFILSFAFKNFVKKRKKIDLIENILRFILQQQCNNLQFLVIDTLFFIKIAEEQQKDKNFESIITELNQIIIQTQIQKEVQNLHYNVKKQIILIRFLLVLLNFKKITNNSIKDQYKKYQRFLEQEQKSKPEQNDLYPSIITTLIPLFNIEILIDLLKLNYHENLQRVELIQEIKENQDESNCLIQMSQIQYSDIMIIAQQLYQFSRLKKIKYDDKFNKYYYEQFNLSYNDDNKHFQKSFIFQLRLLQLESYGEINEQDYQIINILSKINFSYQFKDRKNSIFLIDYFDYLSNVLSYFIKLWKKGYQNLFYQYNNQHELNKKIQFKLFEKEKKILEFISNSSEKSNYKDQLIKLLTIDICTPVYNLLGLVKEDQNVFFLEKFSFKDKQDLKYSEEIYQVREPQEYKNKLVTSEKIQDLVERILEIIDYQNDQKNILEIKEIREYIENQMKEFSNANNKQEIIQKGVFFTKIKYLLLLNKLKQVDISLLSYHQYFYIFQFQIEDLKNNLSYIVCSFQSSYNFYYSLEQIQSVNKLNKLKYILSEVGHIDFDNQLVFILSGEYTLEDVITIDEHYFVYNNETRVLQILKQVIDITLILFEHSYYISDFSFKNFSVYQSIVFENSFNLKYHSISLITQNLSKAIAALKINSMHGYGTNQQFLFLQNISKETYLATAFHQICIEIILMVSSNQIDQGHEYFEKQFKNNQKVVYDKFKQVFLFEEEIHFEFYSQYITDLFTSMKQKNHFCNLFIQFIEKFVFLDKINFSITFQEIKRAVSKLFPQDQAEFRFIHLPKNYKQIKQEINKIRISRSRLNIFNRIPYIYTNKMRSLYEVDITNYQLGFLDNTKLNNIQMYAYDKLKYSDFLNKQLNCLDLVNFFDFIKYNTIQMMIIIYSGFSYKNKDYLKYLDLNLGSEKIQKEISLIENYFFKQSSIKTKSNKLSNNDINFISDLKEKQRDKLNQLCNIKAVQLIKLIIDDTNNQYILESFFLHNFKVKNNLKGIKQIMLFHQKYQYQVINVIAQLQHPNIVLDMIYNKEKHKYSNYYEQIFPNKQFQESQILIEVLLLEITIIVSLIEKNRFDTALNYIIRAEKKIIDRFKIYDMVKIIQRQFILQQFKCVLMIQLNQNIEKQIELLSDLNNYIIQQTKKKNIKLFAKPQKILNDLTNNSISIYLKKFQNQREIQLNSKNQQFMNLQIQHSDVLDLIQQEKMASQETKSKSQIENTQYNSNQYKMQPENVNLKDQTKLSCKPNSYSINQQQIKNDQKENTDTIKRKNLYNHKNNHSIQQQKNMNSEQQIENDQLLRMNVKQKEINFTKNIYVEQSFKMDNNFNQCDFLQSQIQYDIQTEFNINNNSFKYQNNQINIQTQKFQETDNKIQIDLSKLIILGQIGKGGFGVVYLCYDERLHKFIAMKLFQQNPYKTNNQNDFEQISQFLKQSYLVNNNQNKQEYNTEKRIYQHLLNGNKSLSSFICDLLYFNNDKQILLLESGFCSIQEIQQDFYTPEIVLNLLKTLVSFNIVMNQSKLFHGDIKQQNIILYEDQQNKQDWKKLNLESEEIYQLYFKLIDFGSCSNNPDLYYQYNTKKYKCYYYEYNKQIDWDQILYAEMYSSCKVISYIIEDQQDRYHQINEFIQLFLSNNSVYQEKGISQQTLIDLFKNKFDQYENFNKPFKHIDYEYIKEQFFQNANNFNQHHQLNIKEMEVWKTKLLLNEQIQKLKNNSININFLSNTQQIQQLLERIAYISCYQTIQSSLFDDIDQLIEQSLHQLKGKQQCQQLIIKFCYLFFVYNKFDYYDKYLKILYKNYHQNLENNSIQNLFFYNDFLKQIPEYSQIETCLLQYSSKKNSSDQDYLTYEYICSRTFKYIIDQCPQIYQDKISKVISKQEFNYYQCFKINFYFNRYISLIIEYSEINIFIKQNFLKQYLFYIYQDEFKLYFQEGFQQYKMYCQQLNKFVESSVLQMHNRAFNLIQIKQNSISSINASRYIDEQIENQLKENKQKIILDGDNCYLELLYSEILKSKIINTKNNYCPDEAFDLFHQELIEY